MTSREKGEKFEAFIAQTLQEVLRENPPIRPTKASSGGARNTEIGDIQSKRFFVEAKAHDGKFFNKRVWKKLKDSLPMSSAKVPLYIIQQEKENLVALNYDDFLDILRGWFTLEE